MLKGGYPLAGGKAPDNTGTSLFTIGTIERTSSIIFNPSCLVSPLQSFTSSMTTVEHYRPPRLFSDAPVPSNARRSHPSSSIARTNNIPPAAPSPPPFARNSPPQKRTLHEHVPPTFNMASEASSQWLFSDKDILNSPSAAHGVPPEQERLSRAKGADFILHAGCILKLPQLTIATASVFFQRFYMRASIDPKRGHHHYVCAPQTCVATRLSYLRNIHSCALSRIAI